MYSRTLWVCSGTGVPDGVLEGPPVTRSRTPMGRYGTPCPGMPCQRLGTHAFQNGNARPRDACSRMARAHPGTACSRAGICVLGTRAPECHVSILGQRVPECIRTPTGTRVPLRVWACSGTWRVPERAGRVPGRGGGARDADDLSNTAYRGHIFVFFSQMLEGLVRAGCLALEIKVYPSEHPV